MTVRLNDAAIIRLLYTVDGPVGRDMRRRAENVGAIAADNASGDIIGIRSHRLLSDLSVLVEGSAFGPRGIVTTSATSDWHGQPFSYPAHHDRNGRPWLTNALRDGYDIQMAGTGPADAHDLAVDVLAACVEALDTVPVFEPGFVGAPARTFVSPGKPAYDCCDDGQLTVHITPVTETERQRDARINLATLIITSLRCIQTDAQAPIPAEAELVAAQLNRDGWAIWNHLFNLQREGDLFDKCCGVTWGQMTSLPAQGTCGGWLLPITVCLEGYEETFGT